MKRVLTSAHIPSSLEPSGLTRSDGKRLDESDSGSMEVRSLLVWDATYSDTFAPSYRPTQGPG